MWGNIRMHNCPRLAFRCSPGRISCNLRGNWKLRRAASCHTSKWHRTQLQMKMKWSLACNISVFQFEYNRIGRATELPQYAWCIENWLQWKRIHRHANQFSSNGFEKCECGEVGIVCHGQAVYAVCVLLRNNFQSRCVRNYYGVRPEFRPMGA